MAAIWGSVITGVLSLAGVIITCIFTNRKNLTAIKISQAVTETKIEELTREVREHNNFAKRLPVVEEKIAGVEKRLDRLKGCV